MSKKNDKYDDHLEEQKRLQQEQQGFKAMFKHNVVGPMALGFIVGVGGIFTPFEYQAGLIGVGMAAIGFYNMFKD
mgnify:FL=1|jgi:hypothetical protein